jgi:hypothetical protein
LIAFRGINSIEPARLAVQNDCVAILDFGGHAWADHDQHQNDKGKNEPISSHDKHLPVGGSMTMMVPSPYPVGVDYPAADVAALAEIDR